MLRVRGAPLIGVAASQMVGKLALEGLSKAELLKSARDLYEARPTAVNLMICIDRMTDIIEKGASADQIAQLAVQIFQEDVALCDRIAENGAKLFENGDNILTHCNTGGLATAGAGTALAVIRKAHEQGKKIHVYIDETRPLLQGGRLTAWELQKLNIPCTLIADNMAAHLMSLKKISKAIVGSDRIAINGDFANKIGTYSVAVNCHYHNIPFYVAAPYTTVDSKCQCGAEIPIEQRVSTEVTGYGATQWAPKGINVYNPSFDVTPSKLVSGWILDRAVYTKSDIEKGAFKLC
jgi:methylthioribose-1-phosphate isomerase